MTEFTFRSAILVEAVLGITVSVHAQQTPAPTATPPAAAAPAPPAVTTATVTPAAPATPAGKPADDAPSADLIKKARKVGYYRKLTSGKVLFCKKEAVLGSRFIDEHCMGADQLELTLLGQQTQRDQLQHRRGTGTDFH
jgi:hypothetical protein